MTQARHPALAAELRAAGDLEAPTMQVIVVEPDPALAHRVEDLLDELEQAPELLAVADPAELVRYATPGSVVVVGPTHRGAEAIADLQRFRDTHPSARVVLAWDRKPGAPVRDVIAIGAEALVGPNDAVALRQAVTSLLDRAERALPDVLVAPAPEPARPLGRVFTVCSATGGSGKTFYASNLAYLLSKYGKGRVALVDLDLQFGEVVTALRVRFKHTIADAVAVEDDAELEALLPELLVAHESGVWVLPAPSDPAEADTVRPADVRRVIEALQHSFDYVVVDNPTGLGDATLAAMDLSEHLFVLAALDLSSVRNLRLFLQTVDRLQVPDEHMSLVLNKDQSGVGIEAGQVEKLFPRGFRSVVPFSKEVPRSMNQGEPVLAGEPPAELAAAMVEGLLDFLPGAGRAEARADLEAMGPDSFFARLFKRRRSRDDAPSATPPPPLGSTAGDAR